MKKLKNRYRQLDLAYIKQSLITSGRTGNQFLRFSLVGSSGVLVNLAVYTFAIYGLSWHYLPAGTLSFLVAMTNNFILNRYWTFKSHQTGQAGAGGQYFRYFVVTLFGYLVNMALLWVFIDGLHWHEVLSQLLAIMVTTLSNFLGSKLWAFKTG
ncbi:MAG: GtrA family protein [Desulfobacterota bacterium]|nr:GtrA family protein [Thermodesulfobacteriota bacterium]